MEIRASVLENLRRRPSSAVANDLIQVKNVGQREAVTEISSSLIRRSCKGA
jgi:hypothetical protein